mmetsp:Transcript_22276/g.44163  ORF Transcript_22276/g.44163 Transcript_22276/m.44163 type:complete len:223 (-) Transcript_22276:95-763(-)
MQTEKNTQNKTKQSSTHAYNAYVQTMFPSLSVPPLIPLKVRHRHTFTARKPPRPCPAVASCRCGILHQSQQRVAHLSDHAHLAGRFFRSRAVCLCRLGSAHRLILGQQCHERLEVDPLPPRGWALSEEGIDVNIPCVFPQDRTEVRLTDHPRLVDIKSFEGFSNFILLQDELCLQCGSQKFRVVDLVVRILVQPLEYFPRFTLGYLQVLRQQRRQLGQRDCA